MLLVFGCHDYGNGYFYRKRIWISYGNRYCYLIGQRMLDCNTLLHLRDIGVRVG
jgi:hypothetical protein